MTKPRLYITLITVILVSNVYSQDENIADSLILLYKIKSLNEADTTSLELLSNIGYYHSNPDTIIYYSTALIKKAKKLKAKNYISKGYYYLGQAQSRKGLLIDALNSFLTSTKYFQISKNDKGLAACYIAIGDIYSSIENHQSSIEYYDKSLCILEKNNDTLTYGIAKLNIGNEYLFIDSIDSAYNYINEALVIFYKYNHKIGIAYCKSSLGKIYLKNYNIISKAEENINAAIEILTELKDSYSLAINMRYLAKISLLKNKYSEAIRLTESSLGLAQENGFLAQERDAHDLLTKIYKKNNNYEKAFYHLSKFTELKDSIVNKESIQKMADLRTEYEVAQKQSEVEKAEAELALVEKKKEIQQLVGIGLIVGLILVILLVVVLLRNAKRSRKITRVLRNQKEELQIQHDQLEELNKTKDRFFSIISHDLRGPIGVLNGTTMLIKEYLESEDYNQLDELISNMEYSLDKVQKLLDNLLEWAISQQDKYNYSPEPVNINVLTLETISIFSVMAKAKNISLSFEQKHTDVFLNADRNSISTILRNLINNAIKFTNHYGNIDVIIEEDGGKCKIYIKDNGVGISKDRLYTLFDIEAKKSTWGTNREKGLGIGLNLAHEFVKMNKGEIKVFSTLGIGTTFEITFPIYSKKPELNNVVLV